MFSLLHFGGERLRNQLFRSQTAAGWEVEQRLIWGMGLHAVWMTSPLCSLGVRYRDGVMADERVLPAVDLFIAG